MKKVIKDILNMDYNTISNLTKKENKVYFKTILQELSNEANKRLNALKNDSVGKNSPILQSLKKNEGITKFKPYKKISTKNMGQLQHEFSVMKNFLNSKSSTIKGYNKIRSNVAKRIKSKDLFVKNSAYWKKKEKKFWGIYNKLIDEYGGILQQLDSDRIQKMLYKIQNKKGYGSNDEKVQEAMEKYIDELYRAKMSGKRLSDLNFLEGLSIIV